MSNWIIDIEYMIVRHISESSNNNMKIKYENGDVYYCWYLEATECWSKCVPEIRDEYLKQRELEAERILLEGR